MTAYLIEKSSLSGFVAIPSSKSQTLRAILFGMLGNGKSVIHRYLPSPDTSAMVQACRALGTIIHVASEKIEIEGLGKNFSVPSAPIDAGNSGIVLRFIGAVAALSSHNIEITGDYSICHNRHVLPLLDGLTQLGVSATSIKGNGFAPIAIKGPLKNGKATIFGEDSQPVSGLLIASAFAQGSIEINVRNPGEKPWVDLTLSWLDRLGIPYEREGYTRYQLFGNSHYQGFEYTVPGDLSSLAFPLAAAIITGSQIEIGNVNLTDHQGDKILLTVLQQMGANIIVEPKTTSLFINRIHKTLSGQSLDINDYIDAIAILAVLGCYADGVTELRNAAIARKKECDRIHCLAKELKEMGADITELDDGLKIRKSKLRGTTVSSHGDHRLAMALSIAAMGAEGESRIQGIECISKTYPGFLQDMIALGAKIRVVS